MNIKKIVVSILGVGVTLMAGGLLKKGFSKPTRDIIPMNANNMTKKVIDKDMLVLGINNILKWCQVLSNGRRYTCPTKEIDGKLFFYFKKEWHSVIKYLSSHADELVEVDGKTISRTYKE